MARKATPPTKKRPTRPRPEAKGGATKRRPVKVKRRRFSWRKRWLVVAIPAGIFAALIALAPSSKQPHRSAESPDKGFLGNIRTPFRYIPDDDVYALDFDPRKVRIGILEGWDREPEAYRDTSALAYVSGPMYERHVDNAGQEITVPLGDLKLGQRVWRGRNRTASRQRAYVGIRHDGTTDFGFGELTPERARQYDTFIGGLHSVYNDLKDPPPSYKGAYSISMGQRIRYYLPRIRMVFGLRQDGRLEVLMSRDGLTLEQTRELARSRGFLAAYLPDHASKSRFIVPGVKGFTEEDANWISGGATSFVHVPYMLRLSERRLPLQGALLDSLTPKLNAGADCQGPLACTHWLGGKLLDRSLAGLNRVMEQGVEPIARLIWAPKTTAVKDDANPDSVATKNIERSPLREPPITADPLVLRELPAEQNSTDDRDQILEEGSDLDQGISLPPDLPPPLVLRQGEELPLNPGTAPRREPAETVEPEKAAQEQIIGAPPPPLLPPPLPLPPPPPQPLLPSDN
ncbi:MAG: hypothetical protein AB8E87_09770 [Prochlorococcus sp.]